MQNNKIRKQEMIESFHRGNGALVDEDYNAALKVLKIV